MSHDGRHVHVRHLARRGGRFGDYDPRGAETIEWSSPAIARIADLVRDRTGLVFPAARVGDVESAIRRAMERQRVRDVAGFAGLIEHDAPVRDALVAELTIGETYFNRDSAQFELLRERLLPALVRAHGDRRIRVWSAGCASGEEPYSIAMLLHELDARDRAEIIGTDISRPRLQDAQRAIYSKWSLRTMPDDLRRRYFVPRGRYFELHPGIRARVDFRYLNLAEDRFPSLSAGIWGMDVILCRNVLIYFDEETVERVARRLLASLSDDGYLLLGASDPAIAELVECDVVLTDAGLVYRRAGAGGGALAARAEPRARRASAPSEQQATGGQAAEVQDGTPSGSTTLPTPPPEPAANTEFHARDGSAGATAPPAAPAFGHVADATDATKAPRAADAAGAAPRVGAALSESEVAERIAQAYERRDFDNVRVAAARAARAGHLGRDGWVFWLRALANQGCLEEANEVAVRAVDAAGVSAELLYLTAVLELQRGRPTEAAGAARRALYLDRGLIVAHLTLAEAQRQLDNRDGARRSLRNAGLLLAALPPDTVVPASDGETAGRLAELARFKLRLLEAAT